MQRYFFDISGVVSHLRRGAGFTGIQRTVVMLIEHAARDLDPAQVYLGFFSPLRRQYRVLPYAGLAPGTLPDRRRLDIALGFDTRAGVAAHPALRGYRGKPLKLWFHAMRMRLHALFRQEAFFRHRNTTLAEWRQFRRAQNAPLPTAAFDTLARPGDQLVLLDSTVSQGGATAAFLRARQAGLAVHSMVHDLIPMVVPQFCLGTMPLTFHDWLLRTGDYTSAYLANSAATARDLQRFLDTYGLPQPVRVVPLAQAGLPVGGGSPGRMPLLERVDAGAYPVLHAGAGLGDRVRAMPRHPYVLCVGTMEVRKNLWRIAQAWDRMRRRPGLALPKLVFVGRPGWLVEDFEALMRATGNLGGWVEILHGPSDAELDFLYRHCDFTLMASLYEGWGLPVGESLSYGKTAVVSDTTSLPEVGGDLVEYCDPQSIGSIAAACLRLIGEPGRRLELEARIAATRLRGWDDVAADLVRAIRRQDAGDAGDQDAGLRAAGTGDAA